MGKEAARLITGFNVNFISLVGNPANGKEIILKSVDIKEPDGSERFQREFLIEKSDDEKQIVYGLVAVPGEVDVHGDIYTSSAVEKAMEEFMYYGWNNRNIDREHDYEPRDAFVRESWIVKENDSFFSESGAWAVGLKIQNADLWAVIKSGEVNGLSLAGWAYEFSDVDDSGIVGLVEELSAVTKTGETLKKAGKSLSAKTKEVIQNAKDVLEKLLEEHMEKKENKEEDLDMTQEQLQEIVKSVIDEAVKPLSDRLEVMEKNAVDTSTAAEGGNVTPSGEGVEMEKATAEQTKEEMANLVKSAISEAMQPLENRISAMEKATSFRGKTENEPAKQIEKSVFSDMGIVPKNL